MNPLGYYDNGEQWRVDDGRLAEYIRTMHSPGLLNAAGGETVVLGNVVMAMQTAYGESGGYASIYKRPYKISPDGKTIFWNQT